MLIFRLFSSIYHFLRWWAYWLWKLKGQMFDFGLFLFLFGFFFHFVHFDYLMRHLFSYLIHYSVVFQALLNLVLFFIGLFSPFLKFINLIMIWDTLDLRSLDFFWFYFLRFRKNFVIDFEIKDESQPHTWYFVKMSFL